MLSWKDALLMLLAVELCYRCYVGMACYRWKICWNRVLQILIVMDQCAADVNCVGTVCCRCCVEIVRDRCYLHWNNMLYVLTVL